MADLIDNLWQRFCEFSGALSDFSSMGNNRDLILGILFGLAVTAGFFAFRMYFSAIVFLLIIAVSVGVLSPHMSWQYTVAFFSVNGVIFGYLAFRCPKLAADTVCTAIGLAVGYLITGSLIGAAVFGVLFLILTVMFPLYAVYVFLPLFGMLGLVSLYELPVWAGILMLAGGIMAQMLLGTHQKLFTKLMPDFVRDRLEKRKSHAAGI